MNMRSMSKFVRAVAFAALAFAAVFPRLKPADNGVAEPFLDLVPNVTRGLDLVYIPGAQSGAVLESAAPQEEVPPVSSDAEVEVWDGEKALHMSLTDYIIGVTAAEMPVSFELEALKAQAVAARTFTAKHLTGELRCRSGCTVCTSTACCQAYVSVDDMRKNWGSNFDKYYARIREAVLGTDGLVLTCGGELVTALYHSSSGGRTENCEAVFAVALPYLVSVESEGEEEFPEYSTERSWTTAEFVKLINEKFPDAFMTDPEKDVQVWQRTESGRITLIRLGGTVRTGQQLRIALRLRSTNASFAFEDGRVTVTCLGYGHGVGMSQVGADAMAKRGAGFEEILKHYYTGVELTRLPDETSIWLAGQPPV